MQDDFGCVLRGLAGVFAVLLVTLIPAVFFFFNFPVVFLDANAYKTALEDQDVYALVIDALAQEVVSDEISPDADYPPEMYQDAVGGLIEDLFSEEWLQSELEKVIDEGFEFLNSDATELHTSFSFPPFQDRLSGKEGEQIIRNFLDALPPCEPEDVEDVLDYADSMMPYCAPPEDLIEPYIGDIQAMMLEGIGDLEIDNLPIDAAPEGDDLQVLQGYRTFRIVMLVSPVFLLFLAVVIMALAVRSIDGLMNWMGIPFGIGSLFALLTAGILQIYSMSNLKSAVVDALMSDSGDLPVQVVNAIGGVVEQVVGNYFTWIMIESGVLLGLSLLAILVGVVYRRIRGGVE